MVDRSPVKANMFLRYGASSESPRHTNLVLPRPFLAKKYHEASGTTRRQMRDRIREHLMRQLDREMRRRPWCGISDFFRLEFSSCRTLCTIFAQLSGWFRIRYCRRLRHVLWFAAPKTRTKQHARAHKIRQMMQITSCSA